jgi:predicted Zn-dependent protease with MMP-like domain
VAETGLPNMVFLSPPILDHWAEHEEMPGAVVTPCCARIATTGLSDADIEAIEKGVQ